jgi:hypothetical protein
MRSSATQLAQEVAWAHGVEPSRKPAALLVRFSSGGLAFRSKGQPDALRDVRARLNPTSQEIELRGLQPRPWTFACANSAELSVCVAKLKLGARRLRWTPEDLGAFAAMALSNYLAMPHLVIDDRTRVTRLSDVGSHRRLRIELPRELATHSPSQTLYVRPDGLIARHDYIAQSFGMWARAAQLLGDYETFDGLAIATNRVVTPRLGRLRMGGPTLVWIKIAEVETSSATRLQQRRVQRRTSTR